MTPSARWSRFCLLSLGTVYFARLALNFVAGRSRTELSRRTAPLRGAAIPQLADLDAELGILATLPQTGSLSRYKGAAFDAEAESFLSM